MTLHVDKYKLNDYDEYNYRDEEGCHHQSAFDLIWHKYFDFCGCGCPEDAGQYIRDVLALIDEKRNFYELEGEAWLEAYDTYSKKVEAFFNNNSGLEYTMYYLLDQKGLTEHGGSVPGWLTETGREVLEDLTAIFAEEGEE